LPGKGAIRIYYGIKLHSMGVSTAVAALAEDLREFDLVKQSFTNSGFILLLTSFFRPCFSSR
jgi:hypothetical protein